MNLHGSATWATRGDIEQLGLLDAQDGVFRSVVDGAVGRCKTEATQQPVRLDGLTLEELSLGEQ